MTTHSPSPWLAALLVLPLLLGACATLAPETSARADAEALLALTGAESRYHQALDEVTLRQAERNPELKPVLEALAGFWKEQADWPAARAGLVTELLGQYSPAELRAIRGTLEGRHGRAVTGYSEALNRALANRVFAQLQDKQPELERQLQAMRNAAAAGQPGALSLEEDFRAVKVRADAGDPAAQLLLAEKLLYGAGTARDVPLAITWLEKSAAAGHAPALDTLASFHYRAVGMPRDLHKARELLERAAERHYLPAINNLAWLLSTCPLDSERDGKRAVAMLLPVMDQSVQMLDTLAAAQAESGNFGEALELQKRVLAGIGSTADPRYPTAVERLVRYAAGQPWRDPPPVEPGP